MFVSHYMYTQFIIYISMTSFRYGMIRYLERMYFHYTLLFFTSCIFNFTTLGYTLTGYVTNRGYRVIFLLTLHVSMQVVSRGIGHWLRKSVSILSPDIIQTIVNTVFQFPLATPSWFRPNEMRCFI